MNLYVVAKTFEHARRFCVNQGFNFFAVPLASTNANFFIPNYYVSDGDWVARFGPWQEGKNVHKVLSVFEQAQTFTVDAFMLDEHINWPQEIREKYGSNK